MAGERPEYRVLRAIPDRNNASRSAYLEGEYMHAQVVADWDLQIGVDVASVRPESMARPAGNASRAEWATYALAQGRDQEYVDGLSRDQLRAEFEPDLEAAGEEPVKGD